MQIGNARHGPIWYSNFLGHVMLKSLEIKNFRALEDFTVSKLGRVNLIVGKNNSGKSSILEALRIYASNGNPELLREIAGLHDELPQTNETDNGFAEALPFESFFPGRKFPADESRITIGEIGSTTCLQIRYGRQLSELRQITGNSGEVTTHFIRRLLTKDDEASLLADITPVLVVNKGNQDIFIASLINQIILTGNNSAGALLPCAFVPTRFVSFDELANIWDKVGLTDAKAVVFDALRIIAPDFQDLMFVKKDEFSTPSNRITRTTRTPIASLQNIERPVPINSMGDGMARVLQLSLKMFAAKGGILLIDEFENGLHYSVQEKVWQMMFDLAHKLDIQIFATTHSWDCIDSFAKVANQREAGDGELFKVGRSIRTSDHGKITSTVFDGQQLFELTQADMEVR
jgi:predicted ATPase